MVCANLQCLYHVTKAVDNAMEASKNICYTKGEGVLDHSIVTRWSKKFCSGCKNLNDQAKSGRPKTMDSEIMLQAIEANPVSSTHRVPSEFGI